MNKVIPVLLGVLLILSACNPETGILTVSGTYELSLDNNPKIGIFAAGSNFTTVYVNEVAYQEETFVPMVIVTPGGDGSYSIDFPEDLSSVGHLIVWHDSIDDDIFDLENDEQGLFPIKTIGVTDHVITGWESVGNLFYALDGDTQIDLSSVGTGGFDFYNIAF